MKTRRDFATENEYIDWLKLPKRFFSYDPNGDFELHATAGDAADAARQTLEFYTDEAADSCWDESVEQVCWGEINGEVVETSKLNRADCSIDDDGYDEENDLHWNDEWQHITSYDLVATDSAVQDLLKVAEFGMELFKLAETFDIGLGKGWQNFKALAEPAIAKAKGETI